MLDCCAARPCCFPDFAQQWRDSFSLGSSWLRALKGESVPYSVPQRECSDFYVLRLPAAFLSQGSRSQLPSSPVALLSLLACAVPREKAVVSTLRACAAGASLCLQSCSPSLAVFLSFPADPSHTPTGFAGVPQLARGPGGMAVGIGSLGPRPCGAAVLGMERNMFVVIRQSVSVLDLDSELSFVASLGTVSLVWVYLGSQRSQVWR